MITRHKIAASNISILEGGTVIYIKGVKYIRMMDSDNMNIVGYVFNPLIGHWIHWSKLALDEEIVEIE